MSKFQEKEKAIKLREKGLSYSEILKEVKVAKSTLSLWLRSVGLSKQQKQRLTQKKLASMRRGWEARHQQRIDITNAIKNKAKADIGRISKRELWLMGIMLYWAEGSKEREKATGIKFSNSDPQMIKLFLEWLHIICRIPLKDIYFEIYLHKNAVNREKEVQNYWMRMTNSPLSQFQKIIWKKHNLNPKRKNIGKNYYGQLRICVRKSSAFNRKISGWIEGIYNHCRVV